MTGMTLQPDDLLSRTRAQSRADAPLSGLSKDLVDAAWVDLHRHGKLKSNREIGKIHHEGETIKFTLGLEDGHETESVILPMEGRTGRQRITLCLSSQIGCALGCVFCETGTMGLVRNLTTAEIVDQWHHARFQLDARISNIVFMGMGEPMENLDAVLPAIDILTDRSGPAIAPSRISVSTAGRIAGINRYRQFMMENDHGRIRLAVSLNAPNEEIRRSLMPITRADPMNALHDAMQSWLASGGRPILIEYVLIPGVNDAIDHPTMLAEWLGDLDCRINVIPYNPRRDSPWTSPTESSVDAFIEGLRQEGCHVHRRRTMGRDVMAACGQLGNPEIRKRTPIRITR
ncbi:MAG: 23S rRNA (adenine(2503)-C(2))-methyltransferase RlmN [Phycisphaerales bacterium]|nr:23S rRNA (adenine(2503)-C(2))-methyltransferase RlmN [Phycisphaerales bacterium]